jgi:hypothetical protein
VIVLVLPLWVASTAGAVLTVAVLSPSNLIPFVKEILS